MEELVNPNWHVILIHIPLGLLFTGAALAVVARLLGRPDALAAAAWMLAIGGLATLPTAAAGVYALRDVALSGRPQAGLGWDAVVADSGLNAEQWRMIMRHVAWNACGSVLSVACVAVGLRLAPAARARWRDALLAGMLAACALFAVGAWYGGEMVYRHGVAVAPEGQPPGALGVHGHRADLDRVDVDAGPGDGAAALVRHLVPPLQAHVVLGGILLALATAALAAGRTGEDPDRRGWRWAVVLTAGAIVAAAGVWASRAAHGSWSEWLTAATQPRLLVHGLGALLLLAACATRLLGRPRARPARVAGWVIVIALAAQAGWGGLMLLDGRQGPLLQLQESR